MLQLVAEPFDSPVEYEHWGTEWMAQLERADMERYQQSILKTSSYCAFMDDGSRSNADEAPDYQDELQRKLLVLMDMMDRFSNDKKGLTSQTENGSEPPMMNLEPDSTICDEQQQEGVLMVNELPDSKEMPDSNEAVVSESAMNSQFSVNPSLHKQLTIMDSGFKVFSIYCAHMAPKWNNILAMRPKQRNYMSVEVYYTQFFTWRKKLEEVNYIGDEDSYIDDFLYGLKTELSVRVWVYKWKPLTLYGAFRRAEIEETMMKSDAHMVFDKNSEQNECAYEHATMDLHLEGTRCDVNKGTASVITCENLATDVIHDVKWLELAECSKWGHNDGPVLPVFSDFVVQKRALKAFDGMIGTIIEDGLLGIKATNVVHSMLEEKATRPPVNSDGKMDFQTSFPYNLQFSRGVNGSEWVSGSSKFLFKVISKDVPYEDDILRVSVDYPSLSKLGFNPQVFDPGTLSFLKRADYESQLSEMRAGCIVYVQCSFNLFLIIGMNILTKMPVICSIICQNIIHQNRRLVLRGLDNQLVQIGCHLWSILLETYAQRMLLQILFSSSKVMFGETAGFLFDLGISSWHLTWCVQLKSSKIPSSGWHWPQISCDRIAAIGHSYTDAFVLTLFGKIHGVGVNGAKGVDSSLRHVQSAVASGDWYCLIGLNHFHIINSDSHDIFLLRNDSTELEDNFTESLFYRLNSKLLSKSLCCWTLSLDELTNELDLTNYFGSWIGLSPMSANFALYLGICAISVYILEDKDAFERVGKWIIAMDHKIELIFTKPIHTTSWKFPLSIPDGIWLFDEAYHLALLKQISVRVANHLLKKNHSQSEEFSQNAYLDIVSRTSKVRVALLRMLFFTQLVKFAKLNIWWRFVKFRPEQIGNYVNDYLMVSKSHFRQGPVYYAFIIQLQVGDLCDQLAAFRSLYFQLGCCFETALINVLLKTYTLLHAWKCHWDDRKAWVLSAGIEMENFIWNPGIVGFVCSYVTLPISNYAVLHYGRAAASYDRKFIDGDMALLNMRAQFHLYGFGITCTSRVFLESLKKWGRLVGVVDDTNKESLGSTWNIVWGLQVAALGVQRVNDSKILLLFAMAVIVLFGTPEASYHSHLEDKVFARGG